MELQKQHLVTGPSLCCQPSVASTRWQVAGPSPGTPTRKLSRTVLGSPSSPARKIIITVTVTHSNSTVLWPSGTGCTTGFPSSFCPSSFSLANLSEGLFENPDFQEKVVNGIHPQDSWQSVDGWDPLNSKQETWHRNPAGPEWWGFKMLSVPLSLSFHAFSVTPTALSVSQLLQSW